MARALTKKQLEELRYRLEEERSWLLRILETIGPTAPPHDLIIEVEEESEGHERRRLVEVERALAKLDAGNYGMSEETGAPIPYARLAAVPWARQAIGD
jgi:DnaK suppressor protein